MDEAKVENPVKKSFLTWGRGVPGHLERCFGVLLREHSDRLMVDSGDPERLVGRQLDASAGGGPLEFKSHGSVSVLCKDQVYPVYRVASYGCWVGDPVANPSLVFVLVRAPGNARRDRLPAFPVEGMMAHA